MSHSRRIRESGLSWREVDDEIVILDLESSKYFSLNGSAVVLWRALADGADVETLGGLLESTFEISSEQAATDAGAFVENCARLGLVE